MGITGRRKDEKVDCHGRHVTFKTKSFRPSPFLFKSIAVSMLVATPLVARAEEPPPAAPATPAPSHDEPLPEPALWRQSPSPVLDKPSPVGPNRTVEVGLGAGVTSRPATSGSVTYGLGRTVGLHVRTDVWRWIAARVVARWETAAVNFGEGALGLPAGTTYTEPDLNRVYLGASLEPTWYPVPTLGLWAGAGIGWGRTTAQSLYTQGAERVTLPIRSAVFIEVPLSAGIRYEFVKHWLVANLSGHVGLLSGQSGALENPYDTPGKSGRFVTAEGFPELGTSFGVLAGVGCLL